MPKKQPQLAKLSRPRLYKPVARERLYRLLDEKREHPVVWIAGPPGAGKTTLVASYLEAAGVPFIWYQIDPGDSDPATFFFYLKKAVYRLSQGAAKSLPLFTPEYLQELADFSRRFFRQAFAMVPDRCVLVFDNYQESAADSRLHIALVAALTEIPPDANLIIISRTDSPAAFATSMANQTVASVSWEDLQLVPEETAAIALARGITDHNIVRGLYEHSSGWVAGVTLMLERIERGGSVDTLGRAEGIETVFDYFAGMFFDTSPAHIREVLMKVALLPRVSATLAESVTGSPVAIKYIEALHKRHLFTDRRTGREITYQFHALFRVFLQARARQTYSTSEWKKLMERAAVSLEMQGQKDDAFALYVEATIWDAAEKLLLDLAPNLIAQGRWQTLEENIGMIPAERAMDNPWIQYWFGRSRTFLEPRAARTALELAHDVFLELGDEIGQLLCATTILEGYFFEFDDLRPMDPWIERVATLLQIGVRPPLKVDELRAHSAVMMGASYRSPRHSMLKECSRRVVELLQESFDANVKVATASMLQGYSNITMDPEVQRIASLVAHPLLELPHLPASRAFFYRYGEGYSHYLYGRYDQALACFDAADKTMGDAKLREAGIAIRRFTRGLCERRAGLLDRAETTISQIESALIPATGHYRGGYELLKASVLFDRGEIDDAIRHILDSLRAFDDSGHFGGVVLVGTVAANMAISAGCFDLAATLLARLRGEDYGTIAENYLAGIVLNEAWLAHRRGEIVSRQTLIKDAFTRALNEGARMRLRWYGNALAELLPIAIVEDLKKEVAIGLAQEFHVMPQPSDIDAWPWPVKVCTLGTFQLLTNGTSPDYSRKIPKKVLSLLKAIVAFGGSDVPEQKVLDALWPDDEGDAARRSLTATLHRLRKLLLNVNVVSQAGGMLTLSRELCWVDAFAFESRLERKSLTDALNLYRGSFLAQAEEASWIIPMRERLRAKFIQAVGRQCRTLESAGHHDQAIDLYSRGIEADPLVEQFYQGLMRCYDRLGRRTEAMSTFRRLRQTLSVTLGVPPSAESEHLFASMRTA